MSAKMCPRYNFLPFSVITLGFPFGSHSAQWQKFYLHKLHKLEIITSSGLPRCQRRGSPGPTPHPHITISHAGVAEGPPPSLPLAMWFWLKNHNVSTASLCHIPACTSHTTGASRNPEGLSEDLSHTMLGPLLCSTQEREVQCPFASLCQTYPDSDRSSPRLDPGTWRA